MTKITFIILAHENADHVIKLAKLMTEWNSDARAIIHYDLNSSDAEFKKLKAEFSKSESVHLVNDRIRCGWGDFSLVEAVLKGLRLIRDRKIACDRVMLVSGACMPIRPLAQLSAFLDAHPNMEYIETFDADWIIGGLRQERHQYYFLVNHRRRPELFRRLLAIQKFLKINRKMPSGLIPKFGSQWWTLTWPLCAKILEFLDNNPDVYRFFRTTWIPDELFFQTLAFYLVPSENMAGHNLTFYQFNDWGLPLVFSDWHAPLLQTVPRFFARKIAPRANELKKHLSEVATEPYQPDAILPKLQPRWRFPAKELAAKHSKLKRGYTGLFANNGTQTLSQSLLEDNRSFVILYGPPEITSQTIEWARHLAGYTVLGRIFHPEKVDFGAGIHGFRGLKQSDFLLRNEYPVVYLRRIFQRCEGIPVFTMSPGDNPDAEFHFFRSPQAAIFSLLPKATGLAWQDLYWLSCIDEPSAKPLHDAALMHSYMTQPQRLINTDSNIKRVLIEALLNLSKPITQDELELHLTYEHGAKAKAIMHLYQVIASAAISVDFEQTMSILPGALRDRFRPLENGQPIWKLAPDLKFKHAELIAIGGAA
jgi:hypothetical protein